MSKKQKYNYDSPDFCDATDSLMANQKKSFNPTDVKQSTEKRIGRKPKFNYTGKEFLNKIFGLAQQGYTDREIALTIGLSESTFYEKKAANPEISEALAQARVKLNVSVRGAFLKSALGVQYLKKYSYVQKRCECKGKDHDCPICDGTGWITPDQHRVVEEYQQASNPLAQQRWLMNYEPEWRHLELKLKEDTADSDTQVTGIDIQVVFNDKKDLELQEKKDNQNK